MMDYMHKFVLAATCVAAQFTAFADATSATPPDVLRDYAAFWADMSDTSVIKDEDNGLIQWRDKRETAEASATPTKMYGVPAWTNAESTALFEESNGQPPVFVSIGGGVVQRDALYFGGRSGKYLQMKKGNKDSEIFHVCHIFAVHCPSNWFGTFVGAKGASRKTTMMIYPYNESYIYNMASDTGLFWERVDLGNVGKTANNSHVWIDGNLVDKYTYRPFAGFQTFEMEMLSTFQTVSENAAPFGTVFFSQYEAKVATQNYGGGDYLSELIVFTNQLKRVDAEAITAYLKKKWDLPSWKDTDWAINYGAKVLDHSAAPNDTEAKMVKSGETLTIADSEGETTQMSFAGSGSIVKSGDAKLVIGPSGYKPFSGSFDWQSGKLSLRGGAPLPVTATSTMRINSYDAIDDTQEHLRDKQANGGVEIAYANGTASAGKVEKVGVGPALIRGFADDVKTFDVQGGEVTLGMAQNTPNEDDGVEVTITNGDFEAQYCFDAASEGLKFNMTDIPSDAFKNGWRKVGSYSSRLYRCAAGGWAADGSPTNNNNGWTAYGSPKGLAGSPNCMHLKGGNANAYTAVYIPKPGRYELSLDIAVRYWYSYSSVTNDRKVAMPLDVSIGATSASSTRIGTFYGANAIWTHQKLEFEYNNSGNKNLYFTFRKLTDLPKMDNSVFFDNVKLVCKGDLSRDTWPIPNGDFETITENDNFPHMPICLTRCRTKVNGWALSSTAPENFEGINPTIAIINQLTKSVQSWDTNTVGEINSVGTDTAPAAMLNSSVGSGTCALMLLGTSGTAETTFRPPAGKWYLRCRMIRALQRYDYHYISGYRDFMPGYNTVATLQATANGASLGTVATPQRGVDLTGRYQFLTPIEVDGNTDVALSLKLVNSASAGAYVDDLELVRAENTADAETEELIVNGDFESSVGWTFKADPYKEKRYQYNNAALVKYSYWPDVYGYTMMSGRQYLKFQNAGLATRQVQFKSAGLHRLRMPIRSRADENYYGDGRINAWIIKDGTTTTNFIASTVQTYLRNFSEHDYLFNVPEPGIYTFGLESLGRDKELGASYNSESTTCIDDISIKRVNWEVPETIAMNEKMRIKVAQKAVLNLAFTGTNKVASVRYNGALVGAKYVNAETCPKFVTGPGTLEVVHSGLLIIWK